MNMLSKRIAVFISLLAFLCLPGEGAFAQTFTCSTGNFGTVSSQATITGPNSMTMDYLGNITYPAPLTGPATGSPITCTLSGWKSSRDIDIRCDAVRTIANSGGCCGQTNRDMTAFTIRGVGSNTAGPVTCTGINNIVLTVTSTAAGGATLILGTTMDATQVRIGGSYALANHAIGPINIRGRQTGGGPAIDITQTANFTVVFASLVGFTSVTNLAFGVMALSGQPASGDRVDLGTDGTATYTGVFTANGGTLNAGQVTMNNIENGVTVEVYCDTATTMTNGAGKSIQVTGLKVAAEGSTGPYASAGVACTGSGAGTPATTMVYTAGTRDQFFLGGRLDGATASPAFPGGSYATSNSGGVYANVVVLTQ